MTSKFILFLLVWEVGYIQRADKKYKNWNCDWQHHAKMRKKLAFFENYISLKINIQWNSIGKEYKMIYHKIVCDTHKRLKLRLLKIVSITILFIWSSQRNWVTFLILFLNHLEISSVASNYNCMDIILRYFFAEKSMAIKRLSRLF